MTITSQAFDRYRHSPNERTTLLRLVIGTIIIVALWLLITGAVIFAGALAYVKFGPLLGDNELTFDQGGGIQQFLATREGVLATLLTFAGIWAGTWVAMRFIHRERLSRLYGTSQRISRSGFLKGLAAVLLTSVLTEISLYILVPEISRGPITIGAWLLFFIPVVLLAFVQTSSEELLFRGYLLRGLAYRFRSPWVWAVLPTLAFTAMHWSPNSSNLMNVGVMITIGAFAAVLVVLTTATGNLGAAMGAHLGNNVAGFLFISHQSALGSFALYRSPPLDIIPWTATQAVVIVGTSVVAILLTLMLLLHRRSPLYVAEDSASARDVSPAST